MLAGLLLWLALRGVEWTTLKATFLHADYRWLIPVVIVTLVSHWLRAIRWSWFLDVTPGMTADHPAPVSRMNTFVSVMVGYMANYAGPRLGEVIRTVNVAKKEDRSFSTVLGTVVVERVVDMLTFALCLLTLPLVFADQIGPLWSLLTAPVTEWAACTSPLLLTGLVIGVILASAVGLWFLIRGLRGSSRIASIAQQFRVGLLSVTRTGRTGSVIAITMAIWVCYGFMAWIPFLMLGQAGVFGIGALDAWGLMLIGAVGVILPSPGGIGTYHFITIQALAMLFSMPQTEAASYALLTHSGQMLLYVLVGFAGMLFLGATFDVSSTRDESHADS